MTNPPSPPPPLRNQAPILKRMERIAGRVAMYLLVAPVRALPLPVARAIGKGLGGVLYRCLGRYRRVALKNLGLVYADKPAAERVRMARAVFRHFGEAAAEFLKLPQLSREQVDAMTVVEGEEHLLRAL